MSATLKNTQAAPLSISSIAISGGNAAADYVSSGNCPLSPSTLGPEENCRITVTFTPSALGPRTATLTVTDAARTNSPTVALTGTGVASADLTPSSENSGAVAVGIPSATPSVTLPNPQNVAGTSSGMAPTVDFVRGRPLPLGNNAANSLLPVGVSPASLTFASTIVGTTSAAQTLTLTNHLITSLPVSLAIATGDFAVANNTCGSSLGPGLSCTVGVTFRPTVEGTRTGTLTLPYSASGSPSKVSLIGTGNGLISITVTPANPSIGTGNTQQFTATGHFRNGTTQNLTASVLWVSSAPGVATINGAGLASGVSAGSTTITATLVMAGPPPPPPPLPPPPGRVAPGVTPGIPIISPPASPISGSTTLTVTSAAPTLVSIAVTPPNPSIAPGSMQQFTATGTYSDTSTQNLTNTATWSSSATGVATISNTSGTQGLATAVAIGTTTIEASSGAINGSTTLNVASFVLTGSLNTARDQDTATLLNNGLVLIAGGVGPGSASLASAELYHPTTGTFTPTTGSLNTGRDDHTATLLNNGMVLLAGGVANGGASTSAELFDPATGTFSYTTGSLNTARDRHTATLLNNGMVLIAGGVNSSGALTSAELYNPATGTFTLTGSLTTGRYSQTATLLNNGMVLMAGGWGSFNDTLASAELYNPATGTFTVTGSLATARYTHTATLLNNGMVLIAGGYDYPAFITLADAELYNPATGTFTSTGALNTARDAHTATLLNNGMVLIAGGADLNGNALSSAELYNPATGAFTFTASLNTARYNQTATILNNGTVLIAGGDGSSGYLASAELYGPATLTPPNLVSIALAPTSPTVPLGTALRLTATGTFSDNSMEQLASVTWSSSNSAAVNVSNDPSNPGAAYAVGTGSATVSACAGTVCGSTLVTVGPPVLISIAVTPANPSIAPGSMQQFTATGTYSDTSTQDLTNTATWTSSVGAVATISNTSGSQGLATAEIIGTTTIEAALSAINGSTTLGVAGFTSTGSLSNGFYHQTATLLNNGMVLIAGGFNGSTYLASAELYNPATETFTPTGSLQNARNLHTATLLNNGMVLIAGGSNANGPLNSAELYNPATGAFTLTGNLKTARYWHTATMLPNGMVLLAGGEGPGNGILLSAELYNPTAETFTFTSNTLNTARYQHTATLLNNGMVLLAGGQNSSGALASAELYNPSTQHFTFTTGSLNTARDEPTATLLNNGMVLIAGGNNSSGRVGSAELYNPSTQHFTFTTGSLNTARFFGTATLLNNGTVLVAGGFSSAASNNSLASAELYDPVAQTFTLTGSLNTARGEQSATLLTDGTVLMTAGAGLGSTYLSSAEVYQPATLTPPNLVSISLSPSSPTVAVDTVQRFTATGTFSNSSMQQLASVTWSSLNTVDVSITNDASNLGAAYAATGSATVQACTGAVCGSTVVTVGAASLLSISVAPPNVTIATGNMEQYTATGHYSDGSTQNLTSTATWSSSSTGAATISNTAGTQGLATSAGTGATTIKATSGAINGSTPLTVVTQLSPLTITTTNLQDAVVGIPYGAQMVATGGTGFYTWSYNVSGGGQSFPSCLTLSPGTGLLIGTAGIACVGSYTFNVTVTDSLNNQQSQTLSLNIDAAASTVCESGNESVLQGQYAFNLTGYNSSGFFLKVGAFTADGAGNITGGEFDKVGIASAYTTLTLTASTYTVGADERGCATFKNTSGGSFTARFVLGSISGSPATAAAGDIIEFDAANANAVIATGQIFQQTTSTTVTASNFSALSGGYVHLLTGWDTTGNGGRIACDGVKTDTPTSGGAGNIGSGEQYCNDEGVAPGSPTTGITGSYTGVDNYGRYTGTFGTSSLAAYMVSTAGTGALEWTSNGSGALMAGQEFQQAPGPYGSGSITGTAVVYSNGVYDPYNGKVSFALASSNGTMLSLNAYYENDGGNWVANGTTESCPYTVATNGGVTGCGGMMYLTAPTTAVSVGNDPGGFAGYVLPQTVPGGGFTAPNINGTFFGATSEIVNQNAQSQDELVTFQSGSGSALSGSSISDDTSTFSQQPDRLETISGITLGTTGTISSSKHGTSQVSGVAVDTAHFLITNNTDCSGSGTCYPTLTVFGPSMADSVTVAITSPSTSSVNVTAGTTLGLTVAETGVANPGVTWTLNGLPSGSDYGTITGSYPSFTYNAPSRVPTPSTFTLTATSNADVTQSASVSVTITAPAGVSPLTIATTGLPNATASSQYTQILLTSGGTLPVNWRVTSGSLPPGLTLLSTVNGVGVITGYPPNSGTWGFTVTASDASSPTQYASQAFSIIVVNPPLTIGTTGLPNGVQTEPYSQTLEAFGGILPYTWSITVGALPGGLTLSPSTGAITGMPTAAGTFYFTATVTDSTSPTHQTQSRSLSITIVPGTALPCMDSGSESLLSGQYVFTLSGYTSTGYLAVVGSFTANGSGGITAGEVDSNGVGGVQSAVPINTSASSYSVGSNNLGCATIVTSSGATFNTRLSLGSISSNVATDGSLVEWDGPASSTYFAGTGQIAQQNASAISAGLSDGSYAFSESGVDSSGARIGVAGVISASGGSFTGGEFDLNDAGTVSTTSGVTSGTYSSADTNGRIATTTTWMGQSATTAVFYIISSSQLLVITSDSPSTNGALAGQVTQQSGTFTSSSVDGNMVFYQTGLNGGSTGGEAQIGLITADGISSLTVNIYKASGGTVESEAATCPYSVASNGRMTLGGSCANQGAPLFYLTAPNAAFLLSTDSGVGVGQVQPQTGGTFSSASLSGTYFGGDGEVVSFGLASEGLTIGVVTLDGSGGFSFTGEGTSTNGQQEDLFETGTFGTVNSNGTFISMSGGTQIDSIIITSTKFVTFDNEDSNYPLIQLFKQ